MRIYIKKTPSSSFESIDIVDKPLGKGGQGNVHNITTSQYKDCCVKIYKEQQTAQKVYDRIAFMVQNPPKNITGSNSFRICWPIALAYDTNKNFIGYIMPLAFPDSRDLLILSTYNAKPISQQAKYKKYTSWHNKYELTSNVGIKNRIKMLCNWAIAIYSIHETGKYVIIDLKPENVMATSSGKISIVDTDSFQITQNGKLLYPATAFTPDYLAPEGKKLHLAKQPFTVYCDRFAAAVVFYKILTGTHPYSGTVLKPPYDKYVTNEECIEQGLFAYGDKKQYISFNQGLNLHQNFHNLPANIQSLFIRAFGSNPADRPAMEEWGKALHDAADDSIKIAASTVKPATTVPKTPLKITGVTFCDYDYDNNRALTPNGGTLYTDTMYLTPTITYDVLNPIGNVEIWYKLYEPSGSLHNNNSKPGFTWKGVVNLNARGRYSTQLGGWGNDNKTCYSSPGNWKVDFYFRDTFLYSSVVNIRNKTTHPRPTYTPSSSTYTQKKKSSNSVWKWIGGIAATLIFCILAYNFIISPMMGESLYSIANIDAPRTDTISGNAKHNTIPYGTKISVTNKSKKWITGSVDGVDGFFDATNYVSKKDYQILNSIWNSDFEASIINLVRYRRAILDFVKKMNLKTGKDGFRLFMPSAAQFPNSVFFSHISGDRFDYYRDFAFILTNNNTDKAYLAIYSFDEDGNPLYRQMESINTGKSIVNITYSKYKEVYNITYGTLDYSIDDCIKHSKRDIDVSDITFTNCTYENTVINGSDEILFNDKIIYLRPRIYYYGLKDKSTAPIYVKIYNNSGTLMRGTNSPSHSTYQFNLKNINYGHTRLNCNLIGWGNKKGGVYSPGEYIVEIWNQGEKIASKNILLPNSQNVCIENYPKNGKQKNTTKNKTIKDDDKTKVYVPTPPVNTESNDWFSELESYFSQFSVNKLSSKNSQWIVIAILLLSIVLIVLNKIRDGYRLRGGKFIAYWVTFMIISILEISYITLAPGDSTWFCSPDEVGWGGAIISFIIFAVITYYQSICFLNIIEDWRANTRADIALKWGYYSWIGIIIVTIALAFIAESLIPLALFAFAICQIVQIVIIFKDVNYYSGFWDAVFCSLFYIIGSIATVLTILLLISVIFYILIVLMILGLIFGRDK